MCDSATGVAESHGNPLPVALDADCEPSQILAEHGSPAVPGQVQKNLEQALPVRPNWRNRRINVNRQTDVVLLQRRFHDDAELFEQRRKIHARRLIGHLAQIHRSDLFERENQAAEGFEVFVRRELGGQLRTPRKIRMGHRDCAADIADLVRNGAHKDPGSGEKLVQTEFFAVPQILGAVNYHRRQPRARARAVGRKPDIRQKDLAVLPAPAALHGGAERAPLFRGHSGALHIGERRKKFVDRAAGECPCRNREEAVRGFIGQQHDSLRIRSEDRRRAALHENLQLLFHFAAGTDLALNLFGMQECGAAASNDLINEKPHAEEGRKDENVARYSRKRPVEAIEQLGQKGAESRGNGNLPASHDAAGQQHGEQIKESERDVSFNTPIAKCDQRSQHAGPP